jgi:hypothetical protein
VLGRINLLADPLFPPRMATAELCAAFQVGESTVHATVSISKARSGLAHSIRNERCAAWPKGIRWCGWRK